MPLQRGGESKSPVVSLRIKRQPEALGHQKLSRASKFSFGASKFFFFFMLKIFKDEFQAGKFWNLNAKTEWYIN